MKTFSAINESKHNKRTYFSFITDFQIRRKEAFWGFSKEIPNRFNYFNSLESVWLWSVKSNLLQMQPFLRIPDTKKSFSDDQSFSDLLNWRRSNYDFVFTFNEFDFLIFWLFFNIRVGAGSTYISNWFLHLSILKMFWRNKLKLYSYFLIRPELKKIKLSFCSFKWGKN